MDNSRRNRLRAVFYLVLTALLWSSGGLLVKLIHWHPMAIAGTRSTISAIVILVFLRRLEFTWSFNQIGGAIAYAGTVILYVIANKLTTAANAILLQYTAPIYVAIFGMWFLGERVTWKDWLTILLVIGGIAFFFFDRITIDGFWGNICGLASGVAFGWVALFLRKQKTEKPLNTILLGNILTALICFPFMIKSLPTDSSSWIGLICLGIFQLGFSYILYSLAIRHVTALEAVLIPVIEPILNPLWVFIFLGETQGPFSFIGGVIVLGTVTIRGIFVTWNTRGSKMTIERN